MTDVLNSADEAAILEQFVRNKLAIEELEAQQNTIKTFFKERAEAYPAGTDRKNGKFYIKITENKRVDDTLARRHLTATQYRQLTKTVVDGTLARKVLSEKDYAKIVKHYDHKIEIGLN